MYVLSILSWRESDFLHAERENPGCASDGNNSHLLCSWQKRRGFKSNHLASSFDSAPQTPAESTLEKLPTLHNHSSSISYGTGVTKLLGAVYNLISCPASFFLRRLKERRSLLVSHYTLSENCVKLQRLLPVTVCRNNTGKN